jgi:hypothetical protein
MKNLFLTLCYLFVSFIVFAGKFVLIPVTENNNLETLFENNDLKIHYYCDDYVLATTDNLNFAGLVVLEENAFENVDSYAIIFCFENQKEKYLTRIAGSVKTLYSGENFFIMKLIGDGFVPAKNDGMVMVRNTEATMWKTNFNYPVFTEPDENILECISKVNTENIMGYIQHLENYVTRRCNHSNSILAQNWLKEQYESFGLDTTYIHTVTGVYPWWGGGVVQSGNVIAIQYGTEFPDEFIVCGGHYDSYAFGEIEPGADDDASGVSGVMEAARILSQYECKRSIIYCAFTAEECGIDGSDQFAKLCSIQQKNILGYFNLDMIGYVTPGDEIKIHILYPNSAATLADFFYNVCNIYFQEIPKQKYPGHYLNAQSDHKSFNYYGYNGIWWFENPAYGQPYIHTPNDKIGASVNNSQQVTIFTQALIAAIASLAEISSIPPPLNPPTKCEAEYFEDMSIKVTWEAPVETTPNQYNVYRDNNEIAQQVGLIYMDTVADYQNHCYKIKAIYDEGASIFSNESCTSVPAPLTPPPTNCFAEYYDGMSIKVTWDAPEENTPNGYFVYRDNVNIAQPMELFYIDTVADNAIYCYKITAIYETQESNFSNESCDKVPVGISEYRYNINVYPNPTKGEIIITNYESRITDVKIFDVYGKNVLSHTANHLLHTVIDISHLHPGIYFIKIETEKGTVPKKIIKH